MADTFTVRALLRDSLEAIERRLRRVRPSDQSRVRLEAVVRWVYEHVLDGQEARARMFMHAKPPAEEFYSILDVTEPFQEPTPSNRLPQPC